MAVFTKLNKSEIENFVDNYKIGKLNNYEEIIEGIENSNYKIFCNNRYYILTLFEKRVNENDLPFFLKLKEYLNNENFLCPKPIKDKNNNIINKIKNKNAVIISFINGEKIILPTNNDCERIGEITADLHQISMKFPLKRKNSLGLNEWKKIFKKCENKYLEKFNLIFKLLNGELLYLEKNWPNNLPSGIIHADLFRDNVFFNNGEISGIIDFYFSCFDFFIYDIAIIINDWCFDKKEKNFNESLVSSIIRGYNKKRKIQSLEINSLNLVCRAAAVRILVTRLHDYLFHPNNAILVKKDPFEYYDILKWHQINAFNNL